MKAIAASVLTMQNSQLKTYSSPRAKAPAPVLASSLQQGQHAVAARLASAALLRSLLGAAA